MPALVRGVVDRSVRKERCVFKREREKNSRNIKCIRGERDKRKTPAVLTCHGEREKEREREWMREKERGGGEGALEFGMPKYSSLFNGKVSDQVSCLFLPLRKFEMSP